MRRIAPRSAGPTEYVTIFGYPKTFTTSSAIADIKIGAFVCDRVELDDADYNTWNSYSQIKCRVALEMVSGYYNSSLKVNQYGLASKMLGFSVLDDSNFMSDFKCLPFITNVSSNIGSSNGQIIDIYGYGFSSDLNELEIKAGDFNCNVISADTYQIKCEVEAIPLNLSFFSGGSGIAKRLFAAGGIDFVNFEKMIWSKNYTIPLISYSIFNEFDRIPTDDTYILLGFFFVILIVF